MLDVAKQYLEADLAVLPAKRVEKRPAVGAWKQYQTRLPTEAELSAWFANGHDALCILCGAASGHLEAMDFDAGGERFDAWWQRIPVELRARLVVERTPSGGYHVLYRCETPVCGNLKLAQRRLTNKVVALIETRGEGGLFLCAPTPGYELVQGGLTDLPVLTEAERDVLLQAAWELNEYVPAPVGASAPTSPATPATGGDVSRSDGGGGVDRPGDDFNARGDVRALLEKHRWQRVRGGENEYWRRPDKDSGWSATLKDGMFYVFSASAAPFEPNAAYQPFGVYTLLEHGGDFAAAAQALRRDGYGGDQPATDSDVDISAICGSRAEVPPPAGPQDPGPLPEHMLHVPGFIGEVMAYALDTAPYPNLVMAFGGAITLQALLAGRKVRDPGDNRTNIYLLGLAHSAAGKDWPRKVNTQILHQVGLAECLGERFASGEGIQDALFQSPSMLFQTDEIDGMLQSINKATDARHEAMMTTLLTMYSSANSVFPMRRKAGKESPGVIDQPCLVIFGTAIPNHYYSALSERMLTNGFFARMLILEAGQRGKGQEPRIRDLPERVLETAKWWADFHPGERRANLNQVHPTPVIVEHTDDARRLMMETREQADAEYAEAEAASDPVGTTVWGRVSEQTRKLALLYAASEDHRSPRIGLPAVEWASTLVMHQTRRMLFMADSHVAENPFHAECLKLTQKLRDAANGELPHSVLLKRMKMDAKSFTMLIETLVQQGEIEVVTTPRPGWHVRSYRLVEG